MILQALYKLAMDENLMADPDYEMKAVAWLVRVDRDGRLLGIEGTKDVPPDAADGKRKAKPQAKSFRLPRESGRTSGDRAFFLFDKAEYVFGIDPTGSRDPGKLRERADLFLQRARECFSVTKDEGVGAVLNLLESLAAGRQQVTLDNSVAGNDLFAFVFAPDVGQLVTDRPAVCSFWKQLRCNSKAEDSSGVQCLVSGRPCVPVDKHPVLKNVPGGTTSGVSLVSFNQNAFESYGWDGSQNAPVSREAAEACSTALNRLLAVKPPDPNHPDRTLPRRNLRLSEDTVVCYWAGGQGSQEWLDCFGPALAVNPDEVKEVYQSIWQGRPWRLSQDEPFFALTLSGAQGRAIVRDWFESTVQTVVNNLAGHFADLVIVRNAPPPKGQERLPHIPLGVLLESLAPLGKRDAIPPNLGAQLMGAALRGQPYPYAILQRAIERTRAEIGHSEWSDLQRRDARAALIKAVLRRHTRRFKSTSYQEITPMLNQNETNPAYLLGRLLAVIERMQIKSMNDNINASVIDRYFAGAMASPSGVFPRIIPNFHHHAEKVKVENPGFARWLKDEFGEICWKLEPQGSFPPSLALNQQALFALGYHHQYHWLWMTKEAREKWEAEHATTVKA